MKHGAAIVLALAASAILAAEDCRAETVVRGIEYDASEYQITVTLTYDPAAGTLIAESRAE